MIPRASASVNRPPAGCVVVVVEVVDDDDDDDEGGASVVVVVLIGVALVAGSVVVDGAASLRDLNRQLGYDFPVDGPKTLNGLILEHLQEIPEPGTSLKLAGFPVEILQTQHRSIKSVRLPPFDKPQKTN